MIDTDTPEFNMAADAHMISVGSRLFNLPLPVDYAKQTEEIKEKLCVASVAPVIAIAGLRDQLAKDTKNARELQRVEQNTLVSGL